MEKIKIYNIYENIKLMTKAREAWQKDIREGHLEFAENELSAIAERVSK